MKLSQTALLAGSLSVVLTAAGHAESVTVFSPSGLLERPVLATLFAEDFLTPGSDGPQGQLVGPSGSGGPLLGFFQNDTSSFEAQVLDEAGALASGRGFATQLLGRGFASQTSTVDVLDGLQVDFLGFASADNFPGLGLTGTSLLNLGIELADDADYELTLSGSGVSPGDFDTSFFLLEGSEGDVVFSSGELDNLSAGTDGFSFEATVSGRLLAGEYLLTSGALADSDAGGLVGSLSYSFSVQPDAVVATPPTVVPTPAALPVGLMMISGLLYRRRVHA